MSKKINNLDDDFELEDNLDEDLIDEDIMEDFDEYVDEIIQDSDEEEHQNKDFDFKFINRLNKHKLDGKHSLEQDVLFNGRRDERGNIIEQEQVMFFNEDVKVEAGSQYEYESKNHVDYINDVKLENDVFEILSKYTTLDFSQNRRKPKREDFNEYFTILLKHLRTKYTMCELFVALSYYFTDNIFNMYKLLDKKYAITIIIELKNKGYLNNLGGINFV